MSYYSVKCRFIWIPAKWCLLLVTVTILLV